MKTLDASEFYTYVDKCVHAYTHTHTQTYPIHTQNVSIFVLPSCSGRDN